MAFLVAVKSSFPALHNPEHHTQICVTFETSRLSFTCMLGVQNFLFQSWTWCL